MPWSFNDDQGSINNFMTKLNMESSSVKSNSNDQVNTSNMKQNSTDSTQLQKEIKLLADKILRMTRKEEKLRKVIKSKEYNIIYREMLELAKNDSEETKIVRVLIRINRLIRRGIKDIIFSELQES